MKAQIPESVRRSLNHHAATGNPVSIRDEHGRSAIYMPAVIHPASREEMVARMEEAVHAMEAQAPPMGAVPPEPHGEDRNGGCCSGLGRTRKFEVVVWTFVPAALVGVVLGGIAGPQPVTLALLGGLGLGGAAALVAVGLQHCAQRSL